MNVTGEMFPVIETAPSNVIDGVDGKQDQHWFSGSNSELETAIAQGGWFSVGPAMLAGKRGRFLAARMPQDRVLPETDGPFGQINGNPLMPWHAELVAPVLAQLWNRSLESVHEQMRLNLKALVRLPAQDI